jgi:hypothetical protein
MTIHFGVECEDCQEAVLIPIPREWVVEEPAVIQLYLTTGLGFDIPENNKAHAEEIQVFFQEHEEHGARPCVCDLEESDE